MALTLNKIAKICHEANKALCETIGEDSQVSWEDAPDWQRESAVSGAKHHLDNPGRPASDSHVKWMQEKVDVGWKYGPVKDPEKKEHPCIVPFDQLPEDQQAKDALFVGIVHALAQYYIRKLTYVTN